MMKIPLLICLTIFFSFSHSTAQFTYQKTFGGSGFDVCNNASMTSDSGYILTGYTESTGAGIRDLFLVRINSSGDTLGTGTYGGAQTDEGTTVTETFDGGYVAAGYTGSFGTTTSDIYIVKTNSIGDLLWSKTFDYASNDYAFSIAQTSDSGFILTGRTTINMDDIILLRLNSSGDTLWTKVFSGPGQDVGYSVIQVYDGGFVICGRTHNVVSGNDIILIKTDINGNIVWANSYGGNSPEDGWQVIQTTDSGFAIAGSSVNSSYYDFAFLKTDPGGTPVITNMYHKANDDQAKSIRQTSDGGFILAGSSNSFGSLNIEAYLLRIDPNGNPVWSKTFGGSSPEYAVSILPATENGYVLCGYTSTFGGGNYDVYLIRTDSTGNSGCNDSTRTLPTILPGFSYVPSVLQELTSAPTVFNPPTLSTKGTLVYNLCLNNAVLEADANEFKLYPNPASQTIFIENLKKEKFLITNVSGQTVLSGNLHPGVSVIDIKSYRMEFIFLKQMTKKCLS
jgi:hypothetical protein